MRYIVCPIEYLNGMEYFIQDKRHNRFLPVTEEPRTWHSPDRAKVQELVDGLNQRWAEKENDR